MPFSGDLKTISLVELLQWAGNGKNGVLELERNRYCRRIQLRDGHIVACSSNEPASFLGRFLVSKGKIRRSTLQYSLRRQMETGESMPTILEDIGVVTREEILAIVTVRAADTIQGLFEWDDAVFRFEADASLDSHAVAVDLPVEHVVSDGALRANEVRSIRETFASSGLVLERTNQPVPKELEDDPLTPRLLELTTGDQTLAQILLQAPACEYRTLKLMKALHQHGVVSIREQRSPAEGMLTLLDDARPERPAAPEPTGSESAFGSSGVGGRDDLHTRVQAAVGLMAEAKHEEALSILEACYKSAPHDYSLKQLLSEVEASYLEQLRNGPLPPERVPVRILSGTATDSLPPIDSHLLAAVDGETSLQSMLWTAPLQELEAMRSLKRLLDNGYISLDDEASSARSTHGSSEMSVEAVSDAPSPPSIAPTAAALESDESFVEVALTEPRSVPAAHGADEANVDAPAPVFGSSPSAPAESDIPAKNEGNLSGITQPWGVAETSPELDALLDAVDAAGVPVPEHDRPGEPHRTHGGD